MKYSKTKLKLTTALLSALFCFSCNATSSTDNYVLKTISPAGAPTFAYYDQGANDNFKTSNTATDVRDQLAGIDYDCVVFDSITGLNYVKKNSCDFKLATLITGGNFFLVSYDLDEEHVPTNADKFVSFNYGMLPDIVFKALLANFGPWSSWSFDCENTANYLGSTALVKDAILTKQAGYYFIAEPSLFAAKKALGEDASKLKEIANLKSVWKEYSGQNAIPQAGLFVRSSTYSNHEQVVKDYVNLLNDRKAVCVDNPIEAKNAMDTWNSDLTQQAAKFGFNSNIVYAIQKDNQNRLGIIKADEIVGGTRTFVNDFIEKLNNTNYKQYDATYFI